MANDRTVGAGILLGSIVGILLYIYLIITYPLIVLMITALVGVVLILGIMAWIGYTMATAPPPSPVEEETESETAEGSSTEQSNEPSTEK